MLRTVRRAIARSFRRTQPFPGSAVYWENRYLGNGTSGAGSYGRLALFKAEVVNRIVADLAAESIVEWGCGDGAQLALFEVGDYLGIDVSPTVVQACRDRFSNDPSRRFITIKEAAAGGEQLTADIALSLDVVYHLVEDRVFEDYMRHLFGSARRAVVIYSSNREGDGTIANIANHVRHRQFTDWVGANEPGWRLTERVDNRYPFDPEAQTETSFADFFVFTRA